MSILYLKVKRSTTGDKSMSIYELAFLLKKHGTTYQQIISKAVDGVCTFPEIGPVKFERGVSRLHHYNGLPIGERKTIWFGAPLNRTVFV